MSEDNSDIAFLAALTEREMRQKLVGSSSLRYNRTDFRQFLNNGQIPTQMPQPQQMPQYQGSYPPQTDPYQVPDGVIPSSANPQLLPMPPQYAQAVSPSVSPMPSSPETYGGFNIPDYNANNAAQQKKYLEDESEFRAALIKEVKSLKSAIKDLKKQVSTLILHKAPKLKSTETIKNENTNPSEGVHSELHQSD